MDAHTTPTTELVRAEPVDEAPPGFDGPLGALFGGIDLGAMLGAMGVDVPGPDSTTLDDLDESLGELHAKLDWIAAALLLTVDSAPARFRPNLPPYPGDVDD